MINARPLNIQINIATAKDMKISHVFILASLLVSTTSAFARLGETREQIDKRYGQGTRSDIQRLEGAETIKYYFNGLNRQNRLIPLRQTHLGPISHPTTVSIHAPTSETQSQTIKIPVSSNYFRRLVFHCL